ncbi:uncharacterized protein LOC124413636 [Diprion similis]|uniref:uncharacterized protein LOC124413636 n=1 Tax=Diprion similis TaxID=362088 RepID=UPI001EF8E3F9|nr:uncharacterized protein LOC124413636 [Diprion similis]
MTVRRAFWGHLWLAKFFFRLAGILPIGGSSALWKSLLTDFLATLPLWATFYLLVPEIQYICFQNHSVNELLQSFRMLAGLFSVQLRSIFVIVYRPRITRLFSICEAMWEEADLANHKIILPWIKRTKIISSVIFVGASYGVTMHAVNTVVRQFSKPANSTVKLYSSTRNENSTSNSHDAIKFILWTAFTYIRHSYIASCDMIGTILSFNLRGQFSVIRSRIIELSKEKLNVLTGETDRSYEEELAKCIRHHQIVLNLYAELEDVNQYNYLTQLVTEMYIMAISAAELTKFQSLASTALFFSCWPADTLADESIKIARAAYEVPCYNGSRSVNAMVLILLTRSQRPAILTAGKFTPMSLETFASIISGGISFYMLLGRSVFSAGVIKKLRKPSSRQNNSTTSKVES